MTTSKGAPRSPHAHALLLERLARASAAETSQARAREWAAATDAERVAAFVELSRICVEVVRMRGGADAKAPLPKIRITSR